MSKVKAKAKIRDIAIVLNQSWRLAEKYELGIEFSK
jgi:hypothetical protein